MKLLLTTIHELDVTMFSWVMGRKHRVMFTRVGKWVSHTGDGFLYAAYALYLGLSQGTEEHMLLVSALLAFSIERPIYFVLKNGFRRNRPQEALNGFRSFIIPSDQFSFPSGHTSGAFLMATLIASFYPGMIIPAYFWALSVGLSRIFLGVHFPTDILVGMTMGTTIALLGLNLAGI